MIHANHNKQEVHDFVIIEAKDIEAHSSPDIAITAPIIENATQDLQDLGTTVLSLAGAAITFVYSKTKQCFQHQTKEHTYSIDTEKKAHSKQQCILS